MASAVPTPQELTFISKAMQTCVGGFPTVELGGIAERPDHLRKWRYAVFQSLEAAGPHMTQWWSWCWQMAESAHSVYLAAPIMQREGVAVGPRNPSKWAQLETWIKPRVVAAMPQHLKKQLQQRGVQGVRDEVQDILYQLTKMCHPGTPDEKQAVIGQFQTIPTLAADPTQH